jgi:hypothetical protein
LKTKDFLTRKIKTGGFSYNLNVRDHRELPKRSPSAFSHLQPGGDEVERVVSGRLFTPIG